MAYFRLIKLRQTSPSRVAFEVMIILAISVIGVATTALQAVAANPRRGESIKIIKQEPRLEWHETNNELLDYGDGDHYTGVTSWFFHCKPRVDYDIQSEINRAGKIVIALKIKGVAMDLSLSVKTLCAPRDITREHEKGHVEICKRIYNLNAEISARQSCQRAIGKTFSGSGTTRKAALDSAKQRASIFICEQYKRTTAHFAKQIARAYDDITEHGRNKVPAGKAIEEAFRKKNLPR